MSIGRERISVLGIGNPRVGPAIVGALSTFFGEKPIDVLLYDPDIERLELFARFAQVAFSFNRAPHDLTICEDAEDALKDSAKVIVAIDDASARAILRQRGVVDVSTAISEAVESLLAIGPSSVDILDLTGTSRSGPGRYRLPLPAEPTSEELRALPHQILRWIRGEEYLHEFFAQHERSPIRDWLERPESALLG